MNPWPQRCERCALPAELHPHASWRTNGLSLGIWYVLVKQNFAACAAVPFPAVLVLLLPARFLRKKPFPVPAFSPQESSILRHQGRRLRTPDLPQQSLQAGAADPFSPRKTPYSGEPVRIRTVSAGTAPSSRQAGETVFSIFRQNPYAFFPYARICSTRCVVE